MTSEANYGAGPRPGAGKPISLWLAQALIAFLVLVFGYGTLGSVLTLHPVAFPLLGFTAGGIATVVGINRRRKWARPAAGIALVALCVLALSGRYKAVSAGTYSGGAVDSDLVAELLVAVLAWRVGFGGPSRRYFEQPTESKCLD